MAIPLTGATGLVGNDVLRRLVERGQRPQVLVRPSSDRRPRAGLDLEVVAGDLRDADSLRDACRGVDTVIHCGAAVEISPFGRPVPQLPSGVDRRGRSDGGTAADRHDRADCPYVAGRIGDLMTLLTGRTADINSASVALARQSNCFRSTRAEEEFG